MSSLHLFTQNTLPRGKGSGKDKASYFQAILRDFPKHQQLQVFFALNCMSLSKGSIFLYRLKRANKPSLSPADVAGEHTECSPSQAFWRIHLSSLCAPLPASTTRASLCPWHGECTPAAAPQGWGRLSCCQCHSCCASGHWLCYFCPGCTNICSMLELSWVTLRGNATKSVSNTVGSNKTRVNCNAYKQKE